MIRIPARPRSLIGLLAASLLVAAAPALADPPDRVARLAWLTGEASFAPAGESSWYEAGINRPLVPGDRLWTGRDGRAELQLGTALLRLDAGTGIELLNLDDRFLQIELAEGVVGLRIDEWGEGETYEVATANLAFVSATPGSYRLDIAPDGRSTQVTVFEGAAEVYGADGRSLRLRAGSSTRFHDTLLRDVQRMAMPYPDSFDRWVQARDDRYLRSPSRQYVAPGMIGYADLDEWGTWRSHRDYGHVWFPRNVRAGWAPYRDGHWAWIEPWGWTWIDAAPWGFAPSHYGRWVYVSNGWGWVPGPRHVRPVWAPALVAFVGGSNWSVSVSTGGPPIGWFPLGPHDVYVPWYRVSRPYFGRVNVHNTVVINNTYVTNVYNDFYVQGRPVRRDYTFRNAANAVTVVPRDTFVSARNAAESMARLRPGALDQGELLGRAPAAPTRASLTGQSPRRDAPVQRVGDREVIARTEPARGMVPFAQREQAITRNGGEPLAREQIDRMGTPASSARERIRLVEGARQAPVDRAGAEPPGRAPSVRGEAARPGQPPLQEAGRAREARDGASRGIEARETPAPRAPLERERGGAREAIRAPRGELGPAPARPAAQPQPAERGIPLPTRNRAADPERVPVQAPVPRAREAVPPSERMERQVPRREARPQPSQVAPPAPRGLEPQSRPAAPARGPTRGMDAPPAMPARESRPPQRQDAPAAPPPVREEPPQARPRVRQSPPEDDGGRAAARAARESSRQGGRERD